MVIDKIKGNYFLKRHLRNEAIHQAQQFFRKISSYYINKHIQSMDIHMKLSYHYFLYTLVIA